MPNSFLRIAGLILTVILCAQCTEESLLERIADDGPESIASVLADYEKYEVQVVYVQIDRDRDNVPSFTEYTFNVDDNRYFYPASTVKMPIAILSLDKLNRIDKQGLDRNTRMRIDSMRYPQSPVLLDSTSRSGLPSVGHYIRKIFVVSDNDAYNRLYEFVGQDEIYDRLNGIGINNTRIIHRLSDFRFGPEANMITNPVAFFDHDTFVYGQPEVVAEGRAHVEPQGQVKGVGHINATGQQVGEPFDFSKKNFFPLRDQVEVVKRVFFPDVYSEDQRFHLEEDDYTFLRTEMSRLPRESSYPRYDGPDYVDGYVKFFMYGDSDDRIPSNIRIFNKVGWAYGYLTDCAYIVDFDNNIEFILAASVHANANRIYNDGEYEEDEVAIPFLAELGRQVYNYELQRKRKNSPDLSEYKLNYEDD